MIKAKWKKLVLANYAIEPSLLTKYLPLHTQHEYWNDRCFVSLVGFMFLETKILGMKFPFHSNFEEVNLRFYVRRPVQGGWKRGVVFIKEIVPLHAVTFIANTFFREHYETMPMKHSWKLSNERMEIEYQWKKKEWNTLKVTTGSLPYDMVKGSQEDFFTENYWGYNRVHADLTLEYEVEHPPWKFYKPMEYFIQADFGRLYGPEFSFLTNESPYSVIVAEGSGITLKKGTEVKGGRQGARSE